MDSNVIFRKTIAGAQEAQSRRLVVRADLRRLLVLIDGSRDGRALGACFRAGELSPLLDELYRHGLIEPIDSSPRFEVTKDLVDSNDQHLPKLEFDAALTAARDVAHELLGASFREFSPLFDACSGSSGLRIVVDKVSERLIQSYGQDAGSLYVACVRDSAQQARRKK